MESLEHQQHKVPSLLLRNKEDTKIPLQDIILEFLLLSTTLSPKAFHTSTDSLLWWHEGTLDAACSWLAEVNPQVSYFLGLYLTVAVSVTVLPELLVDVLFRMTPVVV